MCLSSAHGSHHETECCATRPTRAATIKVYIVFWWFGLKTPPRLSSGAGRSPALDGIVGRRVCAPIVEPPPPFQMVARQRTREATLLLIWGDFDHLSGQQSQECVGVGASCSSDLLWYLKVCVCFTRVFVGKLGSEHTGSSPGPTYSLGTMCGMRYIVNTDRLPILGIYPRSFCYWNLSYCTYTTRHVYMSWTIN